MIVMDIFSELGAEMIKRNLRDKMLYGIQTFSTDEDSLHSFVERAIEGLKMFLSEQNEDQCPNKEGKYRINIELFEAKD